MTLIYLRQANQNDISKIMGIIHDAQTLLKKDGSSQWQNGYPTTDVFLMDIQRHECFILMVANQVAGVATLTAIDQPDYDNLSDGQWLNTTQAYLTIHRVALSKNFRGMHLGKLLISNLISIGVERGFDNFRIDTHELNHRMQGLIHESGFHYCGLINKGDQVRERRGYELNL